MEKFDNFISNDTKDRRNGNKIILAGLVIQILTFIAVVILIIVVVAKVSTENTVCPNNAPFAVESTLNYTNVTCNCTCPGILPLLEITKNESYKSHDLLYDIIGSLANIKQTIKTTSGAINDVLLAVEKNTSVLLGSILQLLDVTNNASKRSDLDIVSSLASINMTTKKTSGAINDVLLAVEKNTSVLLGGILQLIEITNNASKRSDLILYDIVSSLANINMTIETTSGDVNDVLFAVKKNTSVLLGGILQLLEVTNNASKRSDLILYDIISSLANINMTIETTSGDVNDVLFAVKKNTSVLLGDILQLLEVTNNASKRSDLILYDIVSSLANINMTIETTSGDVNDVLFAVKKNTSVLLGGILQLLEVTNNASERSDLALYDIVGSLANIKQTSTTASGAVNDILLAVEDILDIQNKSYFLLNHLHKVSCKEFKSVYPNSSSGYYRLNGQTVYCKMDSLCGSEEGWTRLAYLDMTDATQSCPSGFGLYTSGNVRACGRSSSGCASVKYETNGISYSAICGRVTGYQYESTDAVQSSSHTNNINSHYVDGVSITRGSPRQHVWTLIAGLSDTYNTGNTRLSNCPCNNPPPVSQTIPSFVGSNYFCESGNHANGWSNNRLYTGDPLWDGQGCGPIETPCCAAPGLPWFHRDYGSTTTTDYIELRVCGDQSSGDEDTPVRYYEIYVK